MELKRSKILSEFIKEGLVELGFIEDHDLDLNNLQSVHGGSINESYKLELDHGSYFIKLNRSREAAHFFECEKQGLELIGDNDLIKVPKVYGIHSNDQCAILFMEFIVDGSPNWRSFSDLGEGLAMLHKRTNEQFGLGQNNFIGTLDQSNTFHSSWIDFFINERLEKQYELALHSNRLEPSLRGMLDKLYKKLEIIIPKEPPSLLHGDLWAGNYKFTSGGNPSLFDPAVYYGHREVDIAMMHLFGGFDKQVFEAYDRVFPLEKDWEYRIDLFNIYPLFVHVNLFGGSYVSRLVQVIRKFV